MIENKSSMNSEIEEAIKKFKLPDQSNSNNNNSNNNNSVEIVNTTTTNSGKKLKYPRFYIPKRFNLIVLGFLALLICYSTRTLLSTTILFINKEYRYGATFKGIVLAAFSMGYCTTQLASQVLCDKFGGKNVLLFGLSMSICTLLLVPVAAENKVAIVMVRIVCGIFQGIAMPSLSWLISKYFPAIERGTCSGVIWSGTYAGNIVISFISPVMLQFLNWRDCFYIIGTVSLIVWSIPWFILIRDDPSKLIGIHENEIAFINQPIDKPVEIKLKLLTQSQAINIKSIIQVNNQITSANNIHNYDNDIVDDSVKGCTQPNMLSESVNTTGSTSSNSISSIVSGIENKITDSTTGGGGEERLGYFVALKTLLSSRGMQTVIFLNISCNWAYFLLLGWYPAWLSKQLHITDLQVGYRYAFFNSLPFILCFGIAIGFGILSDYLLTKGVRKILLRKIFGACCYGIPGVFLLLVALVVPNDYNAMKIAFVTISIAANGFSTISYQIVTLDLSIKYSGVSMGIANICSAIPAIIGPLVAGFLLEAFNYDWNKIFLISSCFYLFGTIIWITFLKVDVVI